MSAKKLLFWASYALTAIIICETLSYAFLAMFLGTVSVRDRTGRLLQIAQQNPMMRFAPAYNPVVKEGRNVIHPYVGFVRVPPNRDVSGGNEPLENYGFSRAGGTLVRTPAPNDVVIGIFGGSVAEYVSLDPDSLQIIGDAVTALPQYKGKKPVFTVAALAGQKQPQFLMSYAYLLTLGAQFDVIMVLGGFNDVTLSPVENVTKGVHELYPRGWYALSVESDPGAKGSTAGLASERSLLATVAQSRPVRWSFSARMAWLVADGWLERRIVRAEISPVAVVEAPTSFAVSGPVLSDVSSGAVLERLADAWTRSNLAMARLAESSGTTAFFFLQPNQHDPGSKPIGAEEALIALTSPPPYAAYVPRGYDLLRTQGKELRRAGVQFFDVSDVFRDHPEPLYTDACCHLSNDGYRILARRMAEAIRGQIHH